MEVCLQNPPVGREEETREGYDRGSCCLDDATVKDVPKEGQ